MTLFWFRINCFNEFVRQRVQNDFRMTLYKWNKENISKHLKNISKIWLILPIYISNSGKMKKNYSFLYSQRFFSAKISEKYPTQKSGYVLQFSSSISH